jgi:hypothetical protein
LKVTTVITGKLCAQWRRVATCITIYEMVALEVVQNGYMHHHSRDGNFIGLFSISSSTSNKISTCHLLYFQQRLYTRSATFLNVFTVLLLMTSNASSITPRPVAPSENHIIPTVFVMRPDKSLFFFILNKSDTGHLTYNNT